MRPIDVAVVGIAAVFVLPVALVVAVAIRLTLGPRVLFAQRRLGRGGVPFTLYKFRTMSAPRPGADSPEFDHERLGRLGLFLRRTSLDELPSFVNVLRGDMALVGPRPLPVHYFDRFRGDEYERFVVRPGVTGHAQLEGRNAIDWDARLALDVEYVRSRSLVGDLRLLGRTVAFVVSGDGVDAADGVTMTELPVDR